MVQEQLVVSSSGRASASSPPRPRRLPTCEEQCAELRSKLHNSLVAQRRLELEVAQREEDSNLLRILVARLQPLIAQAVRSDSLLGDLTLDSHDNLRSTVLEIMEALERGVSCWQTSSCSVAAALVEAEADEPLESSRGTQVVQNLKNLMEDLKHSKELCAGQEAIDALSWEQHKELEQLRFENKELRAQHNPNAAKTQESATMPEDAPESTSQVPPVRSASTRRAHAQPNRDRNAHTSSQHMARSASRESSLSDRGKFEGGAEAMQQAEPRERSARAAQDRAAARLHEGGVPPTAPLRRRSSPIGQLPTSKVRRDVSGPRSNEGSR